MPNTDHAQHTLTAALHENFAHLIEVSEVDIVPLDENQEVEIQADTWTLNLKGWPLTVAWVALDDEGLSRDEQQTNLRNALGTRGLAALLALNGALDGSLVTALTSSADAISTTLAEMIAASGE